MPPSPWQRRIERAQTLANQHLFANEILSLYARVAQFQEALRRKLDTTTATPANPSSALSGPPELPVLISSFDGLLSLIAEHAPTRLAETARTLRVEGEPSWSQLLNNCWLSSGASPTQPAEFLARAFLQPYAEFVRSAMTWDGYTYSLCPFCNRKPGVGVLRQQGDGARRSLLCSLCLAEWEFRRIVCPACGEENNAKLPVYTAEQFDYIRVECCDTCKSYIKSINLTRNGLAEPIVDELASVPLDLWAHDRGYSKLELNLFGM
jgi:FdhE protein